MAMSNIWVAAGDGDLPRLRHLLDQLGISPNIPDPFTYTPMHAAASYGQLDVLHYLISRGGDVNITDSDGDTPLYTVETIETARFLVEHGAIVDRTNNHGISPVQHLDEDFSQVAAYLQSTLTSPSSSSSLSTPQPNPPSQHIQNIASDHLTSELMASVEDIIQRAEADGHDPEEEIRQVVSRTVLQGVVTGFDMSTTDFSDQRDQRDSRIDGVNGTPAKRPRPDDGSG
ncbi:ankyrin [Tricholoma matsutake]|nr:ankyrin [Tricholoma matsutake 945]